MASEMDIQQHVISVLSDAITAAGLQQKLHCFNELSIFRLRHDIWVVMSSTGVPVGVCEVKKPGVNIMNSRYVFGQIYDYMMRLRSFKYLELYQHMNNGVYFGWMMKNVT
jgi:hypothetical protein